MEFLKKEIKLKVKNIDGFYPTYKIGEGSGGAVYLHGDKETGGFCLIKMMEATDWDDQEEFYKDIVWQSMIHEELNKIPSSVKMLGYNIYNGDDGIQYVCFVMEYFSKYFDCWSYIGKDDLWSRNTVTPFSKKNNSKVTQYYTLGRDLKLKYIKSLINCLEEQHKLDIVHGDIKSSNIIVNFTGDAKFIDYGAAIFIEDSRKYMETDWTHGTVGYRAPEEDQNNLLGKCSDIYSLGVTIVELWCGNVWYSGEDFKQCRNEVLKALRTIEKQEQEIGKILRKCLDMNGTKRPTIEKLKKFFNQF